MLLMPDLRDLVRVLRDGNFDGLRLGVIWAVRLPTNREGDSDALRKLRQSAVIPMGLCRMVFIRIRASRRDAFWKGGESDPEI